MIEAEADGVRAGYKRAGWKRERECDGGESAADAAEGFGGLGDGDGVVGEGEPGGGVDLDAGLLGVAEVVDLEEESSGGITLLVRQRQSDGDGGAIIAEDFDGELDAGDGFVGEQEGKEKNEGHQASDE